MQHLVRTYTACQYICLLFSSQERVNPCQTNRIFLKLHTIKKDSPLYILRGHRLYFLKKLYFFIMKIDSVLANSADPDKMQHYAAFHLGLYCLAKYAVRGFPSTKG